ncbi:MAG: transcription termination factor NusA [Lentisphaeria bacterium]|nr:transcription termination factor NusA [Lentisphaeria bacterium]
MNHELLAVLEYIEQERGISKEQLVNAVEKSLTATCQKHLERKAKNVEAKLNRSSGTIKLTAVYDVVETIETYIEKDKDGKEHLKDKSDEQFTLEEARQYDPSAQIGTKLTVEITPKNFGRIVAQTAKQVILQEIRKAEKQTIEDEFRDQVGEIVSGTVRRFEQGNIIVDLQKAEAMIPIKEKVPSEQYMPGDRINALLLRIANKEKDNRVGKERGKESKEDGLILSRASREFIRKLFEREVSEIHDGIVEIVSIARDAGSRTKLAVRSNDPRVDPVGACVGMRGMRVKNITNELNGERVDIIPFSDDLARYVSNALHPAKAEKIEIDYSTATIRFYVDSENSRLAFGKKAQNVRLAQKLIGGDWKIDLKLVEETPAEEDFAEEKQRRTEELSNILGVSVATAQILVANGFLSLEGLSELSEEDLRAIQGLSGKDADAILEKIAQAKS